MKPDSASNSTIDAVFTDTAHLEVPANVQANVGVSDQAEDPTQGSATEPAESPQSVTPKNALVHGVYASDIVLPWESPDDFEHLHRDFVAEWTPQGRQEEETVLTLARWTWLRHRLMRSTQMAMRRDPLVSELEKSGVKTWDEVVRFLQSKGYVEKSLLDEINNAMSSLTAMQENVQKLLKVDMPEVSQACHEISSIKQYFNNIILPRVKTVLGEIEKNRARKFEPARSHRRLTAIETAYHPDYMDKIVRLEAQIDTRIDKTLQRLVTLKEYKRLMQRTDSPKVIQSPSIEPPTSNTQA